MKTRSEEILELARRKGILRASDLEAEGIPRQVLGRLVRQGRLERVARGIYELPGADYTEHHGLVQAARRVPQGIVCLLSALRFHELTTQLPFEVWLALDNKARRPKTPALPLRIVYMSGNSFSEGVSVHEIEGVTVRIFDAAKSVADCFKFRNRVGLDVAIEALKQFRLSGDYDADRLWRYAQICRVARVIRPYMEAVQ